MPKDTGKIDDVWILRRAIELEMEASRLYEDWAKQASDSDLKEVLMDISNEEKVHVGEFMALLFKHDPMLGRKLKEGFKEFREKFINHDEQGNSEDEETLLE